MLLTPSPLPLHTLSRNPSNPLSRTRVHVLIMNLPEPSRLSFSSRGVPKNTKKKIYPFDHKNHHICCSIASVPGVE